MNTIINDAILKNVSLSINRKVVDEFTFSINDTKYSIPIIPIQETQGVNAYMVAAMAHMHLQMEVMKKEIEDLKSNRVSVPEND